MLEPSNGGGTLLSASEVWRLRRKLPGLEALPHGIRARYVCDCRCQKCKAANTRAYHRRETMAKEMAREISAPPMPVSQVWTAPDGAKSVRIYRRGCPGINGAPCPKRAHLRKDSTGCCRACRHRLVWNGLVSAHEARKHLWKLSRAGIGYRAVAAAADLTTSTIAAVRSGRVARIRARTSRRILEVDLGARADGALVSARRVWSFVKLLQDEGYTKARLARDLGLRTPALQFRRWHVRARTAMLMEKLYRRLTS